MTQFEGLPPPENMEGWTPISMSAVRGDDSFTCTPGMAVTEVTAFADLSVLEERILTGISREINRQRGFRGPTAGVLELEGASHRLGDAWRPLGPQWRIVGGTAYMVPFTASVAQCRRGLDVKLREEVVCVPFVVVGTLLSRREEPEGFVGSAIYYPRSSTNRHGTVMAYPITRYEDRPLPPDQIAQEVARAGRDPQEINRRLTALIFEQPFPRRRPGHRPKRH